MATGFPTFNSNTPPQQLPDGGPQQPQGGAPETQGPQQGQRIASPIMQLLGNWHRVAGEIGAHHPQIASMMQKVASITQEGLMILAREATGQQGGLPTDTTAAPQTTPAQPQTNPAGYPPSGN